MGDSLFIQTLSCSAVGLSGMPAACFLIMKLMGPGLKSALRVQRMSVKYSIGKGGSGGGMNDIVIGITLWLAAY